MSRPASIERVSTGVAGLDAMTEGGFLAGHTVLAAGSPGTGKTTLGLHFTAAGAAVDEPTVYVSFEYLPEQLYRDAEARGWPLREWEEAGLVRVLCTSPEILLGRDGVSLLEESVRRIGAKRLVIDSMTHFESLGSDPQALRTQLSGLVNQLRLLGVTTLVTHEVSEIVGPAVRLSTWGLEFMVDAVLLLRYVELEGQLEKAIAVLKFRGSGHDRRFRHIQLGASGMTVEDAYKGVEGLTGGSARRLKERARRLV
ncbi:MAG: RAD55 family ATPase [Thermoplasmatota archaeon]